MPLSKLTTTDNLIRQVRSFAVGVGPGPDGLRVDFLRALLGSGSDEIYALGLAETNSLELGKPTPGENLFLWMRMFARSLWGFLGGMVFKCTLAMGRLGV